MISKVTIIACLLIVILIDLAQTKFTNVPPPPPRPERFRSKEELKKYLQKVLEYHSIVGKWRLRRSADDRFYLKSSDEDLFRFFDINHDQMISKQEFLQRLKYKRMK